MARRSSAVKREPLTQVLSLSVLEVFADVNLTLHVREISILAYLVHSSCPGRRGRLFTLYDAVSRGGGPEGA